MELLERAGELDLLRDALGDAARRRGSVVLVSGEPGIGKSSLLRAWSAAPGEECRLLVGWCDDFLTRRTLGPFHDVARGAGGALADAVARGDTNAVLDALLDELDNPLRPTVLVLEDVHWADEATLDVVRYVGRRLERRPALLVLSYRDGDLHADHPLWGVLASLPTPTVHRVELRPLSSAAVQRLTEGTDLDPRQVAALTGGNPFFVTELVHDGGALPTSVTDAIQARVRHLPPAAREAVEVLSVVPDGIDLAMRDGLGLDPLALALAEARGVLRVDGATVRFRHELTRLAVEASLPVAARLAHHERVLDCLLAHEADDAAILHHATAAARGDVVATHGPRAARVAFGAGAFREAAAHQANVLRHADLLSVEVQAELFEQQAWTLYNLHRVEEALAAARTAVERRAELGEPVARARALIVSSRMHYMANEPGVAVDLADQAAKLLDDHGDAEQRAEGLVARASTYALAEHPADLSLRLGQEAVTRTAELPRPDLQSLALNYRAVAQCAGGRTPDPDDFRAAIRLALEGGHLELAARAWTNLSFELMVAREPSEATRQVLGEALAFMVDHDFTSHAFDIRARLAAIDVAQGNWTDAEAALHRLRDGTDEHGVIDLIALESLARIALRRGDLDADGLLERSWELACRSGAAPYIGLLGVVRMEQAWLHGAGDADARLAALPLERLRPRLRAEALRYAQLAGVPVEAGAEVAEPWASGLRGDWQAAARLWRADRRPYELALELSASGEPEPMLEALTIFDRLGAAPAARLVRRRLRELGVRRLPRGPQATTREHPAGLTERQAQVLALLTEGMTNVEIADRLVLSVRTVDHHVAAVLQKLGVDSRREAAARAAALDVGWR
ncbi:AAA family ATPase [Egicoccus sp. AB-alg2]|uniref:ATP-binding protein n=1 Tax=Egicoccus sp. AB-alg2 TaxID=3242693 RepID=UPI00359E68B9